MRRFTHMTRVLFVLTLFNHFVEPQTCNYMKTYQLITGPRGRTTKHDVGVFNCSNIKSFGEVPANSKAKIDKIQFYDSVLVKVPTHAFQKFLALSELDMRNSGIEDIEMGGFLGLDSLKELLLGENRMKTIRNGVFNHLSKLELLDLSDNLIENIDADSIKGMQSLRKVIFAGNKISDITTFSGATYLTQIDISRNQINDIDRNLFENLNQLKYMNVSKNYLSYLQFGVFRDLKELEVLDLSNNALTSIPLGTLTGLAKLKFLNLSNNHLTKVNGASIQMLIDLKSLNIENNLIREFDSEFFFSPLPKLNETFLDKNPWTCFALFRIVKLFSTAHIKPGTVFDRENINGIACSNEIVEDNGGSVAVNATFNLCKFLVSRLNNTQVGNITIDDIDIPSHISNMNKHLEEITEENSKTTTALTAVFDNFSNTTKVLEQLREQLPALSGIGFHILIEQLSETKWLLENAIKEASSKSTATEMLNKISTTQREHSEILRRLLQVIVEEPLMDIRINRENV